MNALNGPTDSKGLPWYFLVRCILKSESSEHAIKQISSAPRALTANAAMITTAGPLNLEITPDWWKASKQEIMECSCTLITASILLWHQQRTLRQSYLRTIVCEKSSCTILLDKQQLMERFQLMSTGVTGDHENFPTQFAGIQTMTVKLDGSVALYR
ncbi:MAG: hypothetical protein Ct9H300mP19_05700 [Dehalococcoidia bacterium]|nr:MAG: hypothetical protein Ct9H300mP19_05700 [Dehalococcoidia bacterium]